MKKNVYLLGALSLFACNETSKQELAAKYPELKYIDQFNNIDSDSPVDRDSLRQALRLELKNDKEVFQAFRTLTYSWKRLSYHLWLSEEETKAFAAAHGFTHPLAFKYYLLENGNSSDIADFKKELRDKIIESTKNDTVLSLDNDALLNFALANSEERIKDEIMANYKISVGNASDEVCQDYLTSLMDENGKIKKKGCGKIDCCMLACKK